MHRELRHASIPSTANGEFALDLWQGRWRATPVQEELMWDTAAFGSNRWQRVFQVRVEPLIPTFDLLWAGGRGEQMALKGSRSLPEEPAAGTAEGSERRRLAGREQPSAQWVFVCAAVLGLREPWPHGALGSAGEALLDSGLIFHGAVILQENPAPTKLNKRCRKIIVWYKKSPQLMCVTEWRLWLYVLVPKDRQLINQGKKMINVNWVEM